MKTRVKTSVTALMIVLTTAAAFGVMTSCEKGDGDNESSNLVASEDTVVEDTKYYSSKRKRAIYHWKTTYDPTEREKEFLARCDVGRIYIHYFDVTYNDGTIMPEATVRFVQQPDSSLEVVPTVYITVEAMSAMIGEDALNFDHRNVYRDYATKIFARVAAMSRHNHVKHVKELQIDCDWTSSLRSEYFKFLEELRSILHKRGMKLSVTIRLHQLNEFVPPADAGVLMVYNTGNLMSKHTRNSILDKNDVSPYTRKLDYYKLPLDIAYPLFGWQVVYKDGKFHSLASPGEKVTHGNGVEVRREQVDYSTIEEVKGLVESKLWTRGYTTVILYHLDEQFLDLFSYDEIENIYNHY